MMIARPSLLLLLCFCCLALGQPSPVGAVRRLEPIAPSNKRVALAIGNNLYNKNPLRNAVNDATAVAAELRNLGFQTTLVTDATHRAATAAIDHFVNSLQAGDTALFFYAGHGIQVDGENFLLPVDFAATDQASVPYQAYSASQVLQRMEARKSRINVLILDACRDNPFRTWRGAGQGLGSMSSGRGSLIAFSTAVGATATDSPGESNSLFTRYLVEALREPGVGIEALFSGVRNRVDLATSGKQVPWTSSGVVGEVILNEPAMRRLDVQGEIARLEAELKAIEERKRQGLQAEEAERQQAETRAKLRRESQELDRLRLEAERQEKLRVEREKLAAAAVERERQRKADEARLAELRDKTRQQQSAGEMTMEQARLEVARLRQEMETNRLARAAEREKALAKLESDYRPLREMASKQLVKDEFETTAQYQVRVQKQQEESAPIETRYESERRAIEKLYAVAEGDDDRIRILTSRTYPSNCKIEWVSYDADASRLALRVDGMTLRYRVEPATARELRGKLDTLRCESHYAKAVTGQRYTPTPKDPALAVRLEVSPGDTEVNVKDGLKYVWIPPGTFQMGCSSGDGECSSDEKPARTVTLTKGYWLGQTEVTQAAYKRVADENPSHFKGFDLPVESIDWSRAADYCRSIGGRLPTEAEWERAAKGGSNEARYGAVGTIGWYDQNSQSRTHPVAGKAPNGYGLYDMLGNVWEWTADWYDERPPDGTDPQGAVNGKYRVLRGGSWGLNSRYLRASNRNRNEPENRNNNIGFRCVWDARNRIEPARSCKARAVCAGQKPHRACRLASGFRSRHPGDGSQQETDHAPNAKHKPAAGFAVGG